MRLRPACFGQIERFVGAAQQLFGFPLRDREGSDPEGDGDGPERPIVVPELELRNFLPHLLGLAQRRVERALGQEDQEFLASVRLATSDARVDARARPPAPAARGRPLRAEAVVETLK